MKLRCGWADGDPMYEKYHDEEWAVPLYDDTLLFEFLLLEGFQAGLSWITILKKRDHYRRVMDAFNAEKIVRYDEAKIQALLTDKGIIRNQLKIRGAVSNARCFLSLQDHKYQYQGLNQLYHNQIDIDTYFQTIQEKADIPCKQAFYMSMLIELLF